MRTLKRFFAGAALVLLWASFLILLWVFVFYPEARKRTENVTTFVGSVLPCGAIASYLLRDLLRRKSANVSRSLVSWLAGRPLLHACVWVFVAIELAALSVVTPLYRLRVVVTGDSAVPPRGALRVHTTAGNQDLAQAGGAAWPLEYSSGPMFRWRDTVTITLEGAEGYAPQNRVVTPGGLPLVGLVWGGATPVRLTAQSAKLLLTPYPKGARITLRGPGIVGDSSFVGDYAMTFPSGSQVTVTGSAEGYADRTETILVTRDTTYELRLHPQAGFLLLRVVNEESVEQQNMEVFIDEERRGRTPGDPIGIDPGDHRVRVERARGDEVFKAGPFRIKVGAGGVTRCTLETRAWLSHDVPPLPPWGRLLGCTGSGPGDP